MIIYFASGLVLTYGVFRMFTAFLGSGKAHDRLGALINVFFFVIAVFLPFNYIIGVVLFGLGVLFMLSISFEASMLMKLLATAVTFVVLVAVRAGLGFADIQAEGLVLFKLAALMFFAISSIAVELRIYIGKKSSHNKISDMQEKLEEEKNELASKHQLETDELKNHTTGHLENTLKLLELYKLAEVEASIKELIAKNRT